MPRIDNSIRLTELRIQAFRGSVKEVRLCFGEAPVTILFGGNHTGKSSILNALDWVLFSKDCFQGPLVTDRLRERVSWEIRNRHAPTSLRTICTAVFSRTDGRCELTRTLTGESSRSASDLRAVTFDGEELTGEGAAQFVSARICPSFRDFMSTVYLHQEVIRDVLTIKPEERGDAIDRLLGLAPLRDLARALKEAKLAQFVHGLDQDLGAFEGQLDAVRRDRKRRIEVAEAKASELGLSRKNLSLTHGSKLAREALERLKSMASSAGLPEPQVDLPTEEEDLQRYATDFRSALDQARTELPDVRKLPDLTRLSGVLTDARTAYAQRRRKTQEAEQNLTEYQKEKGTRQKLEARQAELAKLRRDKAAELCQHNARAAAIRDAIQYVEALGSPADATACPVCGRRVNGEELLAHLKTEATQRVDARSQELSQQIDQLDAQASQMEQSLKKLTQLERHLQESAGELETEQRNVGELLKTALAEKDDPEALLNRRLLAIGNEIDARKQAADSRVNELRALEKEYVGALECLARVLAEHTKVKELGTIQETDEFKKLRDLQRQGSSLKAAAEAIGSAAAAVSQTVAKQAISGAGKLAQDIFVRIADHPEVRSVRFLVGEKTVGGILRNEYSIRDGEDRSVVPILSQGDMNALALGLFIGLGLSASSISLNFMIFDDPTQSLAKAQKERLAEVLDGAASSRQLIIATMDAEFLEALNSRITKRKQVFEFRSWTREGGPDFVERS